MDSIYKFRKIHSSVHEWCRVSKPNSDEDCL